MTTALEALHTAYHDRDTAARAWKQAGGRVVGYMCDSVPEELIAAAGFLPYRVSGDPDGGQKRLPPEAVLDARAVGLEFVNSMFHLLTTGRYDFLDYLVVPHSRKAILQLHTRLTAFGAANPGAMLPTLYILDRAITPFLSSSLFNRERILAFRAELERWSGAAIEAPSLAAAIAASNEARALAASLGEHRTAEHPLVSGAETLAIFGAAKFMLRDAHTKLLQAFLAEVPARPPRGGPRVFVSGSPLDNADLYAAIEATGATVVGESHCWGSRCAERTVATDIDPFEAIADRYATAPPCLTYPLAASVAAKSARAKACRADTVILHIYEYDDLQLWDAPDEIAAFERLGLRCLYLAEQPYKLAAAAVERLRAFLQPAGEA